VFLPVLAPRGRLWGLAFLAAFVLLSLATLPLTILQLQALFGFGARPLRLDYLVFLWAFVPYLWRKPEPFDFLHLSWWRAKANAFRLPRARELGRMGREFLGLSPRPSPGTE
jgi:hypothetical protein